MCLFHNFSGGEGLCGLLSTLRQVALRHETKTIILFEKKLVGVMSCLCPTHPTLFSEFGGGTSS
jgi:hypothetical protein